MAERATVGRAHRGGQALCLVAELAQPGELVGDCVLFWRSQQHQRGEIGYVFNPAYHGRGLATEAAGALLRLGFEGLNLHRIVARCDARNGASARVMERLGMRREAHLVQNEFFKGEWADELIYAILRTSGRRGRQLAEVSLTGSGQASPAASASWRAAEWQAQQAQGPFLFELQRPGWRRADAPDPAPEFGHLRPDARLGQNL